MEPMQVAIIVLVVAGVWAVVELALVFRRLRGTMDAVDSTMGRLDDVIDEARPVISKLDGAVDELSPALSQVDPIMKQLGNSAEALSADLIEVNGILRDVSQVTGAASSAGEAVSTITDAAAGKVERLLGKRTRRFVPDGSGEGRTLIEDSSSRDGEQDAAGASQVDGAAHEAAAEPSGSYYTYGNDNKDKEAVDA